MKSASGLAQSKTLARGRALCRRLATAALEAAPWFAHHFNVLDLTPFQDLPLSGGFRLVEVQLTAKPLLDPIERAATAQTIIRGRCFHVYLRADLDERELSVALYHEVLEAATVATDAPPEAVLELNEGGFERAAQLAQERWGIASPQSLNQMLADFGFRD